jgi:hypothetical protein
MTMPTTNTFVSIRGQGTMRRDQTAAWLQHDDDQSWTQSPLKLGVRARILVQPTHAMANLRTTIGLIVGLLLVWFVIVAA